MDRDGPGLLLRDILSGEAGDVERGLAMIATVSPDILFLTGFDYDHGQVALRAFAERAGYPHAFALRPNTGARTGLDLDGDQRTGGPGDAQGYGAFSGQGGMALLSRFSFGEGPIDFSQMLWRDLPGASMTADERTAFGDVLRLSSRGHWSVPVELAPGQSLTLLAWHAGTPAFDNSTGRNQRRNGDENRFWQLLLDGKLPGKPEGDFVLIGTANLDPADGLGDRAAIRDLLAHPALQDPRPESRGAVQAAAAQGGVNASHRGDPALDTADWRDENGPGNLRVQYVLPSRDLKVTGAGVFWPASDEPGAEILTGRDPGQSWHGLVWVDIAR